jgi:hypothetical protein
MNIKSREQKQFEEWAQVLIAIIADLDPNTRKEILEYAIYKYNSQIEEN